MIPLITPDEKEVKNEITMRFLCPCDAVGNIFAPVMQWKTYRHLQGDLIHHS
jgi:hypothetical protein